LLHKPSTEPNTTPESQPVATVPSPPVVDPIGPVSEPLPSVDTESTAAALTVEEPPAAPALVNAGSNITLTSRVGTGTVALTAILIVLIAGAWFYGNRLASHLTVRRSNHA
jgi:hypothetical protein